jgi:hypothetical protein
MLWWQENGSIAVSGPDTKRYPVRDCIAWLAAAEVHFKALKVLVHSCFRRKKIFKIALPRIGKTIWNHGPHKSTWSAKAISTTDDPD